MLHGMPWKRTEHSKPGEELFDMNFGPLYQSAIVRLSALLLVIAVIVGGVTWYERRQDRKLEEALREQASFIRDVIWTDDNTIVLDGDTFGIDHRIESFLFVGTDASGGRRDSSGATHGPMADFLLLMVIDHTADSIGFLQIDRNTVTEVMELDRNGAMINSRDLQICTAHWYGFSPEMSIRNTMDSVCVLLGELPDIDGYFVIGMEDIGRLNHAVNGVEVAIEDDLTGADSALRPGETVLLSDEQAEAFLRARVGLENEENAERMRRQRAFISGFVGKIKQGTLEDPAYGIQVWNALREVAFKNMSANDFSRSAQMLLKGDDKGTRTLAGETVIGDIIGDGLGHEEFYPDESSVREVMLDLFSLTPVDVIGDDEEDPDEEDLDEEDSENESPDEEDSDVYAGDEDE